METKEIVNEVIVDRYGMTKRFSDHQSALNYMESRKFVEITTSYNEGTLTLTVY